MAVEKVAAARRAVLNGTSKKAKAKPSADAAASAPTADSGETSKYRDRAQERRRVHNQPDIPNLPNTRSSSKNTAASGPSETPAKAAPPVDLGKDENNIGNKLLKKMGWSEGAGLGSAGDGRVNPM